MENNKYRNFILMCLVPSFVLFTGSAMGQAAIPSGSEAFKVVGPDICLDASKFDKAYYVIADDRSNVYPSLAKCLASGGKLTEEKKNELRKDNKFETLETLQQAELSGQQQREEDAKFAGISWGLALAFVSMEENRIEDVAIENGQVRVTKQSKSRAIAMVESHYFFNKDGNNFGHGPFVAIGVIGEDGVDPLSTFGVGYMVGWKRKSSGSWNVGIGYFIDTEFPQFREGIKDGDTTTETDPDKLLVTEDETDLLIMFSAQF